MMKAGKYYIGDLCYVMHEKWDEFCAITITKDGVCLDGEFKFSNGVDFASYGTMYGDGVYEDNLGNEYGVDAGLIGCVKIDDIDFSNEENKLSIAGGLGSVVEFENDFETGGDNGLITFGHIEIETGDSNEGDC